MLRRIVRRGRCEKTDEDKEGKQIREKVIKKVLFKRGSHFALPLQPTFLRFFLGGRGRVLTACNEDDGSTSNRSKEMGTNIQKKNKKLDFGKLDFSDNEVHEERRSTG